MDIRKTYKQAKMYLSRFVSCYADYFIAYGIKVVRITSKNILTGGMSLTFNFLD